jgi:hypothetical protein
MAKKRPEESSVRMSELVLPNDTNLLGGLEYDYIQKRKDCEYNA